MNPLPPKILYYCKDCAKLVSAKPVGRSYVYRCGICGTKNVAFGTEKSLRNFYHIEEAEQTEPGKKSEPSQPSQPSEQVSK